MPRATFSQSERLAGALRALAADYTQLNWSLFGDQLKPAPLFAASGASRLGYWRPEPRGIALAESLLLEGSWGQVLEVLKHEMAHQFVDEVLGITDESAHGPSFQQTCQRLGIDASSAGLGPTSAHPQGGVQGKLQRRVAQLLALADSPNKHEAEAAMRAAHRLMLQHNIEGAADDADFGFLHLGRATGRSTEAERALAGLLGEFFFVQPIWVSVFRVEDQKRANRLEITGRRENLAMAEYAYHFLLHAADALWNDHKRARGIRGNGDRQAYRAGVVRGFADKLREERTQQRGRGLVWVGDARADAHFRRRHPRVRTTSARSTGATHAAGEGRAAGRGLVLNRPLDGGARKGPRRLLGS